MTTDKVKNWLILETTGQGTVLAHGTRYQRGPNKLYGPGVAVELSPAEARWLGELLLRAANLAEREIVGKPHRLSGVEEARVNPVTGAGYTWRDSCAHNPECLSQADCEALDSRLAARPVELSTVTAGGGAALASVTSAPKFPEAYLGLLQEIAKLYHAEADELSRPIPRNADSWPRRRALVCRARAQALEAALERLKAL